VAGPAPRHLVSRVTGQEVERPLAELAAAHGVATSYVGADDRTVVVARDTVVRVLAALDVDAGTQDAISAALAAAQRAPWLRLLSPTVVLGPGSPAPVVVRGPAGLPPRVRAELEDGRTVEFPVAPQPVETRLVDGERYAAWASRPPVDLPLGWHRLVATLAGRAGTATLVVGPDQLTVPAPPDRQAWGWTVQLYAVRSAGSWGMGDLADLAELARWSGAEQGAAAVLCNPLHAISPVSPVEASPYYPSSRRWWNPLYLRVEAMAEYADADADGAIRARVDALRLPPDGDRIDRDAVWAAKAVAWELLWPLAQRHHGGELAEFRLDRGAALQTYAVFCALTERHGLPWQHWPSGLRRPDGPEVTAAADALADRVAFQAWLQLRCEDQLAQAQAAAAAAGMSVGVLHDLAVGADPGGADAWALQDVLAESVTIGAPPDAFAPMGQSWGLPPWRPDRMAELGYAPYRDLLRSVLRYADGLRVDHVLGLFRQWWVPAGEPPAGGTYVRYDDEALLGVLALEAHRAGALLIGEDLGTVEPRVRAALTDRGMLGSAVLWFQRDEEGVLLPPQRWREQAAASVSTHDLPTAAGFLAGGPPHERAELLAALRSWGLYDDADGAAAPDVVAAMHALLARTPCRLVLAALADGVGDLRRPNWPGTTSEYPNWLLPVARPDGDGFAPVSLEELRVAPGVRRLAEALGGKPVGASVRSAGDDPAGPRSRRP